MSFQADSNNTVIYESNRTMVTTEERQKLHWRLCVYPYPVKLKRVRVLEIQPLTSTLHSSLDSPCPSLQVWVYPGVSSHQRAAWMWPYHVQLSPSVTIFHCYPRRPYTITHNPKYSHNTPRHVYTLHITLIKIPLLRLQNSFHISSLAYRPSPDDKCY